MRAFISLDVTNHDTLEKLQDELATDARWNLRDFKMVEKRNFHFTIIFLGEIDLVITDKIKLKLSELQFEPIKITFTGLGAFPRPRSARVIWVGVDPEGSKKMISLAELVTIKMVDIGFKLDKPFTPHMTLFRKKTGNLNIEHLLDLYEGTTFGSDVIDKVHLKQSDLTYSGPIYSDIFTVHANE